MPSDGILQAGRGGIHQPPAIKDTSGRRGWADTVTDADRPAAANRCPATARSIPDGFLRHLPRRRQPLTPTLRDALDKLQHQRRVPFALSRRLPWPWGFGFRCGFPGASPHGDHHPGAAGAGIRPRPHHHRPERSSTTLTLRPSGEEMVAIDNPHQPTRHIPPPSTARQGAYVVEAHIYTPSELCGHASWKLCQDKRRGTFLKI